MSQIHLQLIPVHRKKQLWLQTGCSRQDKLSFHHAFHAEIWQQQKNLSFLLICFYLTNCCIFSRVFKINLKKMKHLPKICQTNMVLNYSLSKTQINFLNLFKMWVYDPKLGSVQGCSDLELCIGTSLAIKKRIAIHVMIQYVSRYVTRQSRRKYFPFLFNYDLIKTFSE